MWLKSVMTDLAMIFLHCMHDTARQSETKKGLQVAMRADQVKAELVGTLAWFSRA